MPTDAVRSAAGLFRLNGRRAFVTGGSRGLGRAIALGLADAGAEVVVASRDVAACRSVVCEVNGRGGTAYAVPVHVGRWETLDPVVEHVESTIGPVDVLVNNAGMSPIAPSSLETSEALWDKIHAVNLKGPFRLSALFGERMYQRGRGSIINISSMAAVRPSPAMAPYAAAKAGLHAVTVALAAEYGPCVRVNAVVCGPFHTDATAGWSRSEETARRAASWPSGRVGDPEEVVGATIWLAGDAASFTTASLVRVDGGSVGVV